MEYSTKKIIIVALTLILIGSVILSFWHFLNDEHFEATSPSLPTPTTVSIAPMDLIAKLAVLAAPPPAQKK